jgi:hypothetical protein
MITIMLITHIILLSFSMIANTIMTIMALVGNRVPVLTQKINLVGTIIGIVLGALLLIQHPLGSRCVELTAYVVVFGFAYRFVAARSRRLTNQTLEATD